MWQVSKLTTEKHAGDGGGLHTYNHLLKVFGDCLRRRCSFLIPLCPLTIFFGGLFFSISQLHAVNSISSVFAQGWAFFLTLCEREGPGHWQYYKVVAKRRLILHSRNRNICVNVKALTTGSVTKWSLKLWKFFLLINTSAQARKQNVLTKTHGCMCVCIDLESKICIQHAQAYTYIHHQIHAHDIHPVMSASNSSVTPHM